MMPSRMLRAFPYAVAVAALAGVLLLARQNRQLGNRLTAALQKIGFPYAGMDVPAFTTTTLDADTVTVGAGPEDSRDVLFLFTTTCEYCRASVPAWSEVAESLATIPSAEVFGVALDSADLVRPYAEEHGMSFPLLRFPNDKLPRMYGGRLVPTTIVLDGGGRVLWARVGELDRTTALDSVLGAARVFPRQATENRWR